MKAITPVARVGFGPALEDTDEPCPTKGIATKVQYLVHIEDSDEVI